jgi:acetyl-CoA/propionyl-CoA carboxylase biotin carboxyl carrier protein
MVAEDGRFYFLEMNTRIQVEHTITEAVTGIDLVKEQLLVAAGRPLSFDQDDVAPRGHAIECRINAEDAGRDFAPSPGVVSRFAPPGGLGVRVDTAFEDGAAILPAYDSLIAKLVVWGRDRPEALARTHRALREFRIVGVPTTVPFHQRLIAHPVFVAGEATTALLAEHPEVLPPPAMPVEAANGAADVPPRDLTVEVDGRRLAVRVHGTTIARSRAAVAAAPRLAPRGPSVRQGLQHAASDGPS